MFHVISNRLANPVLFEVLISTQPPQAIDRQSIVDLLSLQF